MRARGRLEEILTDLFVPGRASRIAEEILDEHARELAAAIRTEYEGHPRPEGLDPYWAADLIDPDEEA